MTITNMESNSLPTVKNKPAKNSNTIKIFFSFIAISILIGCNKLFVFTYLTLPKIYIHLPKSPSIFVRMKMLMVCLGNICRSPLAEGILKHKAKQAGLNWVVESAGTGAYHIGEAPHTLSQKVAKLNGVNICDQRARMYQRNFILEYDKIYVMDSENYNEVKRISGNLWDPSKVDLLLNELYPGENRSVQDPWYSTEPGYHEVYHLINKACDNIIKKYGTKETV